MQRRISLKSNPVAEKAVPIGERFADLVGAHNIT